MEIFYLIIKICVLIMSVFLVVAVLLQEGKSYGLGAIEGGADTFFGKSKGKQVSSKLSRLTTVVAIVFVAVVVVLGVFSQKNASHYDPINPEETIVDPNYNSKTEEATATPTESESTHTHSHATAAPTTTAPATTATAAPTTTPAPADGE